MKSDSFLNNLLLRQLVFILNLHQKSIGKISKSFLLGLGSFHNNIFHIVPKNTSAIT